MPTKNPRINITIEPETMEILTQMAEQERTSVSSLSKELILDALDRREDIALTKIAYERDIDGAPRLSDKDVWDN